MGGEIRKLMPYATFISPNRRAILSMPRRSTNTGAVKATKQPANKDIML